MMRAHVVLALQAVLSVRPLPLGADGNHIFPEDVD